MKTSRFRPVAAVLLCLHLVGCYSWKPVSVSPRDFIERETPKELRVWDASDELTVLRRPRIIGDSIAAFVTQSLANWSRTETVLRGRIAVSDVARAQYKSMKLMATFGTVSGVAVLLTLAAAVFGVWDSDRSF
jgi:hypothetical protein